MTVTLKAQIYCGTPAWRDLTYYDVYLTFTGGSSINNPVAVGQYNTDLHSKNARTNPNTDNCGATHLPGIKYAGASSFITGGSTFALNDTNLTPEMCSLRIVLTSTSPVSVVRAGINVYGQSLYYNNYAHVQCFEQGIGSAGWTLIYDKSASYMPVFDLHIPDVPVLTHEWYIALSLSAEQIDYHYLNIVPFVEYQVT